MPDFVGRSIASAAAFGIAHEVLDAEEVTRRYPHFQLRGDEHAYFEPGGGLVYPERCIAAQLSEAERFGATILRNTKVEHIRESAHGMELETAGGLLEAEELIVAAGAWTTGLLGEGSGPEDSFYGFPLVPGVKTPGVKVAMESIAEVNQPDDLPRNGLGEEASDMYQRHVCGRLTGLGSRVLRSAACLYTSTRDAHFVLGPSLSHRRVLVVSACSGHGFKHSAAIGEMAAKRIVEGERVAIPIAFDPARFRT